MIQIDRILVPTDFSDFSKKALTYAVALAKAHQAEIVMLHVIGPPVRPLEEQVMGKSYAEIEDEIRTECERQIVTLQQEGVRGEVPSRTRLADGVPFDEIAQAAVDLDSDLIVIATHGYTGLKRVLLGSVAEKVVQRAPCPVLLVKEKEREFVRED